VVLSSSSSGFTIKQTKIKPENREPTMFLSTTDDLLRALNIACRWPLESHEDITITIIDLGPPGSDARRRFFETHNITHAEEIAKSLG
jgi:hypothetical protein